MKPSPPVPEEAIVEAVVDEVCDAEPVRKWLCAKARDLIKRKHDEIEQARPDLEGKKKTIAASDMLALAAMYREYRDLARVPRPPTQSESGGPNGAARNSVSVKLLADDKKDLETEPG